MVNFRAVKNGGQPGVEEDTELKWGHIKFLALTPTPKNLHQNLQLHLILRNVHVMFRPFSYWESAA